MASITVEVVIGNLSNGDLAEAPSKIGKVLSELSRNPSSPVYGCAFDDVREVDREEDEQPEE